MVDIFCSRVVRFLFVLIVISAKSLAQNLTVEVGKPPLAPVPLVNRADSWRYHKGTNAPAPDWKTATDASLGAQWATGTGGFGYADNTTETSLCGTVLSDMLGKYTTLYIRKSFVTSATPDPNAHLLLTLDYDDAFVAYLDGAEVARSSNTPGAVGTEPLYSTNALSTHESSRGAAPVNAPTTYDLGIVGNRIDPGTHVLSVIGLNQSSGSSDFILIASLAVTQPSVGANVSGPFLAIVDASLANVSGSNTVAGATRVTINGDEAKMDPLTKTWAKTNTLVPGFNNLFIAALDDAGNLLASSNRIVVSEPTFTAVGGTLDTSTTWSPSMGVIHVTNQTVIPSGGTLTIQAGTTLLMTPGSSIVGTNATLIAAGTQVDRIYFVPADGASGNWGGLIISGTNGVMMLQHVETIAGHVELFDGATGTLSDSYFHDYLVASPPIIHTLGSPNPVTLNIDRCHVARYHELLAQLSTNHISYSLFEYLDYSGDGIDFDQSFEGSYIKHTTVRRGLQFNTDALDMGEYTVGSKVTIDSCLLHDFVDKGVSMGIAVDVIVTNTLIYNVDSGFGVKDNSVARIYNCTVANANYGIRAYNKFDSTATTGGGHVTDSFNNIFWGITNLAVSLANGSTLVANYTDFQGTNYPGIGNFSADPLFLDAPAHNYRLKAGSPALGAGLNGADLGVQYPVGGIPATPLNLAVIGNGYDYPRLTWIDDADNEFEYIIERSTDGVNWTIAAEILGNTTEYVDVNAPAGQRLYYRLFALNEGGPSDKSNIASGTRKLLNVVSGGSIGGTLTSDTEISANASVSVSSTINVPSGVTLYIKPGARVLFGAGMNLVVQDGGKLLAEGTAAAPILFTRAGSSGSWGNLTIMGSVGSPESVVSYARFEFNAPSSSNPAIELNRGSATLDHLSFGETTSPYIHLDGGSFVVSNCEFPSCAPGSAFELVHGTGGVKADGRGIIRHNFFGSTLGYNDVVDFTGGNRPSPIVQFYNNVFSGSSDDEIDVDGTDAWIEGNIFLHCHKNGTPDTSSAISGGNDSGQTSEVTIVGNLFFDCDQAATAKQGNFYTMLNNTIVHITPVGGLDTEAAAINVQDVGTTFGAGYYLEGNIITDTPELVRAYVASSTLVTFTNNILPLAWNGPGGGNVVADPLLKHIPTVAETKFTNWADAQILWDWFSLQPGSVASGTGPNGSDRGGVKENGVTISGQPSAPTSDRSATLTVGFNRTGNGISPTGWPNGSGFSVYKWRLDAGVWSNETPITTPITLAALTPGQHTVEVIGKNDAAFYQNDPDLGEDATVSSVTWTITEGLQISSVVSSGADIHIHFTATAGATYTVEYKNTLNDVSWTKLKDIPAQPATGDIDVVDVAPTSQTRFYRIVTP